MDRNQLGTVFVIVMLAGLFFLFIQVSDFTKSILSIFERNLGTSLFVKLLIPIIYCAILFGLAWIVIKILRDRSSDKTSEWGMITTIIMCGVFFTGISFIDAEFGVKNPIVDLYAETMTFGNLPRGDPMNINMSDKVGELECSDTLNQWNLGAGLVAGDFFTCKTAQLHNITNPLARIKRLNATSLELNEMNGGAWVHDDTVFLLVPPDATSFSISLDGSDANNRSKNSTTYGYQPISSQDDYRKRRYDFMTYILILFGVVFFSIPNGAANLKNIWNE